MLGCPILHETWPSNFRVIWRHFFNVFPKFFDFARLKISLESGGIKTRFFRDFTKKSNSRKFENFDSKLFSENYKFLILRVFNTDKNRYNSTSDLDFYIPQNFRIANITIIRKFLQFRNHIIGMAIGFTVSNDRRLFLCARKDKKSLRLPTYNNNWITE